LKTWSAATVVTNSSSLFKARDLVPARTAPARYMKVKVTRP
jgi:hypothetical protein